MANSKLIPVSLLLLLAGSLSVVSAGSIIDFVNALQPGATKDQDMDMLKPVPDAIKKKLPQEIKEQMQGIKVSDLKKELKAGKDALNQCLMQMKGPKECMKDLKAAMPKLAGLASAIKKSLKKQMDKLYRKIQEIIPQLNSPTLKNMLQTVLNMMPMPTSMRRRKRSAAMDMPSAAPHNRKKRSATAMDMPSAAPHNRKKRDTTISIKIQIMSMQQSPMSMQQVKSLLKQIKDKIIQMLSGSPPSSPSSPSILQQIVNMLSSMSPKIAKFFSNPAVTSFLGTQPPPSS